MDQITKDRILLLHPMIRKEADFIYVEICDALKGRAICRFSYTLRSFAEQNDLYAQGRTKPGKIVTWVKGGFSFHNYGLAVDIVLLIDKDGNGTYESASWETDVDFDGDGKEDWMEVVAIFKKYGWEWGGDWPKKKSDRPHFQKPFGFTCAQLKVLHDKSEFIPGTTYVKLAA